MNRFLPSRYDELVHRLAVGLEPVDATRGGRVAHPLRVVRDAPLAEERLLQLRDERREVGDVLPSLRRRDSGRFALLYSPELYDAADPFVRVRLLEGTGDFHPRRFVPRRLRLPLLDPDAADEEPPGLRVFRPALFPGADYPIHDSATAFRGRVFRDGRPMRWARVVATRPDSGVVVGHAHGDDRGEFFLLLGPRAATPGELQLTLTVRVAVHGPQTAPVPTSELVAATDRLWDLPLEELPSTTASDPVSGGTQLPAHYTRSTSRDVLLPLGRTTSDDHPFEIA